MIHPAFLLFEGITYLLFIACLIHAARRGLPFVGELVGGLLFGLLLEVVNVRMGAYHYGRFLVMLGEIPLGVGVGWAVIIYTAMATSDRLGLTPWTRPPADALLALNIDLAMDAIAIRLGEGMWVWYWQDPALRWTGGWFGVPLGNFYGWLYVVLLYSTFVRLLRHAGKRQGWGSWWGVIYPLLAVLLSEPSLYGVLRLSAELTYGRGLPDWPFLAVPLGLALGAVLGWGRPRPTGRPTGWVVPAVPLVFHLFFLGTMAVFPLAGWTPWLVAVSLAMLGIGLWVHLGVGRRA
ncbi:MAG TPA: carotenoid biosynthesis protein [Anaerolineales bacterium]|nr:carotenoid biosynthesis protein [Anaerolineae bacterium]HIQ02594.1 carotenoid biosynthesis protein [Anaerolineales bacterium]